MMRVLVSPLIPVVPMMPAAISPAAAVIGMVPVMPAAVAPSAIVVRMVVAASVIMLVPAMAPVIADVGGLLDVGSFRRRSADTRGHRGRRSGGEGSAAEGGETDKCRNKFHDVHLLMLVGGGVREFGSVHYRGLIPMNVDEFPAMNRVCG